MPSRSWAERGLAGAAALLTLAWAGCGDDNGSLSDAATLRVYVSLPLSGPSGGDGRDAADGARLALADADGEAGAVAIEAVYRDAADAQGWSPVRSAANARAATQDATAIAYLGDFESGATRASLPITNEARLLQVSPASSAVDLVAPELGSDEVPDVQPTGERTFGRVIPADDVQAAGAAEWARMLDDRASIESDRTPFGRTLTDGFRLAAVARGLTVAARDAPVTFLAGRPALGGGQEIGTDAYLLPPRQDAPTRVTSAALDPSMLRGPGRDFTSRFADEYGRQPGRYAAYGYEAMALILDSIDRASDPADRPAVIEAFFDTVDRESVVGKYSIDDLGNTSLERMTGYRVEGGRAVPWLPLHGG